MKRLLSHLNHYRKESILGPLFKLLEASFELLVLLGVIGLVCSITAQYFAAKAAVGCSRELRRDLFVHLNRFSYSQLDAIGVSTLITRLTSDINQVQSGINLVLRLFLRSPFIVFGAMVMAFTIDVKAALLFVAVIPILSVIVFGIMYISMPYYKKVQSQQDRVLLHVRENLAGVRVVRAFNRQEEEKEAFHKDSRELMETQLFVGKISVLLNPPTYVVINGVLKEKPGMTEGRILEGTPGSRIPKVEFRDVGMAYHTTGDRALEHITFAAMPEETIGIIGGTGSGKSSLVNLIPRFYDVVEGSVLVDGADVREYTYGALRGKIAVVPQKAVLFSGTIRENIRWGKKDASDEEILEALEITRAREILEQKEEGLDTRILQGGRNKCVKAGASSHWKI